jgi:hypothetical protein
VSDPGSNGERAGYSDDEELDFPSPAGGSDSDGRPRGRLRGRAAKVPTKRSRAPTRSSGAAASASTSKRIRATRCVKCGQGAKDRCTIPLSVSHGVTPLHSMRHRASNQNVQLRASPWPWIRQASQTQGYQHVSSRGLTVTAITAKPLVV